MNTANTLIAAMSSPGHFPPIQPLHYHVAQALTAASDPMSIHELAEAIEPHLNRFATSHELYMALRDLTGILTHHVSPTLRIERTELPRRRHQGGRAAHAYRITRTPLDPQS